MGRRTEFCSRYGDRSLPHHLRTQPPIPCIPGVLTGNKGRDLPFGDDNLPPQGLHSVSAYLDKGTSLPHFYSCHYRCSIM
jgi:hypothetical protein